MYKKKIRIINDHNTYKEYEDNALNKNIFTDKIIKDIEMNAIFKNKKIIR